MLRRADRRLRASLGSTRSNTIGVGEHGERQFAFSDLFERLSGLTPPGAAPDARGADGAGREAGNDAGCRRGGERRRAGARLRRTGKAHPTNVARALESFTSYVRDTAKAEGLEPGKLTELADRDLHRACKAIAARHGVGWFTVRRAVVKVTKPAARAWALPAARQKSRTFASRIRARVGSLLPILLFGRALRQLRASAATWPASQSRRWT